jgi:hypothetical protein
MTFLRQREGQVAADSAAASDHYSHRSPARGVIARPRAPQPPHRRAPRG